MRDVHDPEQLCHQVVRHQPELQVLLERVVLRGRHPEREPEQRLDPGGLDVPDDLGELALGDVEEVGLRGNPPQKNPKKIGVKSIRSKSLRGATRVPEQHPGSVGGTCALTAARNKHTGGKTRQKCRETPESGLTKKSPICMQK